MAEEKRVVYIFSCERNSREKKERERKAGGCFIRELMKRECVSNASR